MGPERGSAQVPQTEFTGQLLDVSFIQLNLELAQSDNSACRQKMKAPLESLGKFSSFLLKSPLHCLVSSAKESSGLHK